VVTACWWCGAEAEVFELQAFGGRVDRFLGAWPPATDHEHAERPPTPGELQQAGHEALTRIQGALS
jgi:hypothetical protein